MMFKPAAKVIVKAAGLLPSLRNISTTVFCPLGHYFLIPFALVSHGSLSTVVLSALGTDSGSYSLFTLPEQ